MKLCPFCKGTELDVSRVGDDQYSVICINCSAEGPIGRIEEEAIDKWENREVTSRGTNDRDYHSDIFKAAIGTETEITLPHPTGYGDG